jgi:hypothetical protein
MEQWNNGMVGSPINLILSLGKPLVLPVRLEKV